MLEILLRGATRPLLLHSRFFQPLRHFSKSGNLQLKTVGDAAAVKEGELVKDIVLYRHEKPRFIAIVSLFSFLQCTFWTLLGRNMMDLRDLPVEKEKATPFWKRINWGGSVTKNVMTVTCFLIGTLSITIGWFYVLRSVRYVVLRKNRDNVSVVTYTPFGRNRFIEAPINNLSCQGSRAEGGQMPLKIKGRFFMFLIDSKSGVFPNTRLFDQTVGMHRKL